MYIYIIDMILIYIYIYRNSERLQKTKERERRRKGKDVGEGVTGKGRPTSQRAWEGRKDTYMRDWIELGVEVF